MTDLPSEHLTPDEASLLQVLDEWRSTGDLHKTMRSRDRSWTPLRVWTALQPLVEAGFAVASGAEPETYRRVDKRPGAIPPP